MSSKKTVENNSTPLSGVKIKVEPGTSAAPLLKNIKTEPGLVTPPSPRLTSFRVPRDLTLGASVKTEKPKKVYAPNINVQRNKKKDDGAPVKKETKPLRGRGRGRGQGDRGRGRGKIPNNLIQSTGVFSEGITDTSRSGKRYSRYNDSSDCSRDAKSLMEKPVLNLNQTINKEEEEEKLKSLLRDDFIDDGTDPCLENGPVMLPLIDDGKLYKSETKAETKMEVTQEEEEIDVKPIILSNGEAVMPPKSIKIKGKIQPVNHGNKEKTDITIPQILESQTNGYMLIQFPDCLPGLRPSDESTEPRARKQNEQNPAPASDNSTKSEYCTMGSLKGGLLGKIQVCKSGKARFLVGDNTMIVDLGSRLSFRQDLVAAKIDTDNANSELVNLGRVNNTLICSPDWETMLASL